MLDLGRSVNRVVVEGLGRLGCPSGERLSLGVLFGIFRWRVCSPGGCLGDWGECRGADRGACHFWNVLHEMNQREVCDAS